MAYIIVTIILFVLELLYFKVADHFDIIDKPNERSSHSSVTLLGGGIIFYFGICIYFLLSGFYYPFFFIGLTLLAIVSFMDDLCTLSIRLRFFTQLFAVLLMAYELQLFSMPWYYLLMSLVLAIGIINAYNFMDGINGMTTCYSLTVGILLIYVNKKVKFIDQELLFYTMISVAVFAFFNFRKQARCFAGDIGSISMAFILLFALGTLIIYTGNLIYILFLVVYGIDVIWTIIERLYHKKNIFEGHRSHLYQLLGNEAKINALLIALVYGLIQLGIGYMVVVFASKGLIAQLVFSIAILIGLSLVYIILKNYIIKRYLVH